MFWSVQITAAAEGLAVLCGPAGLVVVDDPEQLLRAGSATIIVATPPGQQPPPGVQLGTWNARPIPGTELALLTQGGSRLTLPWCCDLDTVQVTVAARPSPLPACTPADAWAVLLRTCTDEPNTAPPPNPPQVEPQPSPRPALAADLSDLFARLFHAPEPQ